MSPTPFRPVLLVVDVQEDFCPPNGALAVPDGRAVVPVINDLLTLPFVLKIATKDHHPPNHISFASHHGPGAKPYVSFTTVINPANPNEKYETRLWPDHCIAGTPGNALVHELHSEHLDRVVMKGQDPRVEMYSAFRSPLNDPPLASAVSELSPLLAEHQITDVFVVGLAGDYCVFHSAMASAADGYKTYIIEEATRSVGGQEGWEKAAGEMHAKGISIVHTDGEELRRVRELTVNG